MGTYTYVVNDVQGWNFFFLFFFSCKPVSLSYHVCISADHPTFFFGQSDPTILIYIEHLKLLLWSTKCPQNWQRLYKSSKRSNKIHLGEICSKQSLNLTSLIFFRAYALVMNTIHFSKGFWQYVRFPQLYTQHLENDRERDWMQYTIELKRDVFSPLCVHHIFLSYSFPLGICFAPTPRVKIKKLFQKAAFFILQAEQSSLSHNSFNNFSW